MNAITMERPTATKETEFYDLTNLIIEFHAMEQYGNKCFPGLSLLSIREQIHEKLKQVRKTDLGDKMKRNRSAYIDEDNMIYIVDEHDGHVITVYPRDRIFIAKPMNRKKGQRYR